MQTIDLGKLMVFGELAMRANLNFTRLEGEKYWPETYRGQVLYGRALCSWQTEQRRGLS